MKNRMKRALWLVAGALLATGMVTCAVALAPSPVQEKVTLEAGSQKVPLGSFPKEGKEVELLTDVSGIDLNQPGEYLLAFAYKKKVYNSTLQIVDTTPPAGVPVARTIYNDETLKPEDFVTEIRDLTQTAVSFAKTPDFDRVGEQTVTILLTDIPAM